MAKEDDELVPVEDLDQSVAQVPDEDPLEAAGDERVAQQDDAADEPEGRSPEETEAIRAQRRLERKAKKQREHEARDRNRKELDYLRSRNEVLERRFSTLEQRAFQSEFTGLDSQLATIEGQLKTADQVIAKGITDRDGETVTEAQNIKQELLDAKARINEQKHRVVYEARQAQQAPQQQAAEHPPQPEVDPELVAHASRWKDRNPWYKGGNADQDSAIVTAVDNRLAQDGYDPSTAEYWQELDNRLQKALPHRYRANGNGNGQSASRPSMANGARERALKPGEIYVSPERKEALMEMGVWDDPKLRQKYLKAFATYDADAKNPNPSR